MLTKFALFVVVLLSAAGLAQLEEELCFASMVNEGPSNDVFLSGDLEVSSISARTVQKCGLQYPDCFRTKDIPYITDPGFLVPDDTVCRETLRYVVPLAATMPPPPDLAVSESAQCKFPDLTDPCVCQVPVSYSTIGNITFDVSLGTENCCQQCSCIGDPHCTAFSGAYDNWVVCNARNPKTCDLNRADCLRRTWNGVPCRFSADSRGNAQCLPEPSSELQPIMTMYSKIYVHPTLGTQYKMKIDLRLGSMGNIVCVNSTYGPSDDSSITVLPICTPAYGGFGVPANVQNSQWVGLNEISQLFQNSKVQIQIQIKNPDGMAERLELWVDDKDTSDEQLRSGFCETGVITEKLAEDTVFCTPSDEFIYRRMCWNNLLEKNAQCNRKTKVAKSVAFSKRQWCQDAFPNNVASCATTPWYRMICLALCRADSSCVLGCESRITEVPNEVIQELKSAPNAKAPTKSPTIPPTTCPLAMSAMHEFGTPVQPNAYLVVQKQLTAQPESWSDPMLWFTKEQVMCGQKVTLPAESELMDRGFTYRMLQCQPTVDRCGQKVVSVDTKVTYVNPGTPNGGISLPLRVLYDGGKLSCSRSKYPLCPPEYKCCIWTPDMMVEWKNCMALNHADFYNNPARPCRPSWT